jgi:putative FmdB family regulatory protein
VPIYEYSCTKCGETVEAMQKMSDPPLTTCPKCGGALAKMISSTSFILKGTGWYATDYAKKGNGSGNGKRTDHKDHGDHGKDAGIKKDTSAVEKTTETKTDTVPEKTIDKAAKSGSGD